MDQKKSFLLLLFLFFSIHSFAVSPDSFVLETRSLTPYVAAYTGNGHFSLATDLLGLRDAESFMAWVYDHGKEDVPRNAVLPAWNSIDIVSGGSKLSEVQPGPDTIRAYVQRINMYDGSVETRYDWINGENRIEVNARTFVSRSNPHLAGVRLTIVPHYSGPMSIHFALRDWPDPKRLPLETLQKIEPDAKVWYPGNMTVKDRNGKTASASGQIWMTSASEGRNTTVSQFVEARWPSGLKGSNSNVVTNESAISIVLNFQAIENQSYTFYKYIGVASSHNSKDPSKAASDAVASTKARAWDVIFGEHAKAWEQLWKTDIEIEGDPEFQRIVRAQMFYLLCSIAEGTDFSLPPMGLSSAGYYGHIFWDADTWMFPPLLVTHPELAKSIVMFRYRILDAAQHKAKNLGFAGAMYPWEADEIGNETTPQFAYQNALYEIHITGDVALAQWQYYLATGDKKWLAEFGYPVLRETANFWLSRVKWNAEKKRYETEKVVSVDEGLIGIHNDTYTNTVAKKNLEIAIAAATVLGIEANSEWKKVAAGLFIPYNEAESYHPAYENAPSETRGSVVPLLSYPLGLPMSEEAKRNNLHHAVERLKKEGAGAMMTLTLFPLIAAELGDQELLNDLVPRSYKEHLQPPYYVPSETPSGRGTAFITGSGGLLQQVIFGYSGLRLTEDGLVQKFKEVLPSNIKKLRFKNFRVRNKTLNFEWPK